MILEYSGLIITFCFIPSNLLWMTFDLRILDLQTVLSHLAWFNITFIWIKVCQLLMIKLFMIKQILTKKTHISKISLEYSLIYFLKLKEFSTQRNEWFWQKPSISTIEHYQNAHNLVRFSVLCHLGLDHLVFGGIALLNSQHWSLINYWLAPH